MARRASKAYPQFAGLINTWMTQGDMRTLWEYDNSFGEAMSIWDDFVQYVLDLVSEHPAYTETVKATPSSVSGVERGRDPLQLKDARLKPWLIVDILDLERMSNVILSTSGTSRCYQKTRYAFSAAAVALQFMASRSEKTRNSVRKIILQEDHISVSQPESHGQGFITLCQENTKPVVERRVSLWKTVFPIRSSHSMQYIHGAECDMKSSHFESDRLLAVDITRSVGDWMKEAMILPSLGMPAGSYTLVLDGDPLPEHTSKVFRIFQRDASWRMALDVCYAQVLFPNTPWLRQCRHPSFSYRNLSHVIRTLSTEGSLIRCNFSPGPLFDIERMLEERRRWFLEDWKRDWSKHEVREFQTEKPLPPWHLLRWQHVLL